MSNLEDYQTPKASQAQQNPASRMIVSGTTTPTSSTRDYRAAASKPWTGSYTAAVARSHARYVAAGDEHSSHSDEEHIAVLPHTYFKPVQCPEEEDAAHRTAANLNEFFADTPNPFVKGTPLRLHKELSRAPSVLTPPPLFSTPEFRKPKLLVNSLGHKTTAPTKAQLRVAAARECWELDAERRALQQLAQCEDSLW